MLGSGWRIDPGEGLTLADKKYECDPCMVHTGGGALVATWATTDNHYGARAGNIAYSSDGGTSWSPTQATFPVASLTGDDTNWVASMELRRDPLRGFFRTSTDGGVTWTAPVQLNWASTSWTFPADLKWMDDGTPDGLLMATEYGGEGILTLFSTDRGATWQKRGKPKQGPVWEDATENGSVMLDNGDILMLIRNDTLSTIEMVKSSDKGWTWTTPKVVLNNLSGYPRLTTMPDGTILVTLRDVTPTAVPDRSWWMGWSKDDGETWEATQLTTGFMMYGCVVVLPDGTARMIGSDQNRNDVTRARTWLRTITPLSGMDFSPTVHGDPLRVELHMFGIPVGTSYVEVRDPHTNQRLARMDVAGTEGLAIDYTAPATEAHYLVRAYDASDTLLTEVSRTVATLDPPKSHIWISDPLDETSPILVQMLASGDRSRPLETRVETAHTVSGRTIASIGPTVKGTWEIAIDVDGPEMIRKLQTFFAEASSILVRCGPEMFMPGRLYGAFPAASEYLRLYPTAIGGTWTLSITPVDSPGILPVISSWTWEAFEEMCEALDITWDTVGNHFPTWLDVERGPIGDE